MTKSPANEWEEQIKKDINNWVNDNCFIDWEDAHDIMSDEEFINFPDIASKELYLLFDYYRQRDVKQARLSLLSELEEKVKKYRKTHNDSQVGQGAKMAIDHIRSLINNLKKGEE